MAQPSIPTLAVSYPPKAALWSFLTPSLWRGNPLEGLIRAHQRYGSIYRLKLFFMHATVLSGPEAISFVAKHSDFFTNAGYRDLEEVLGQHNTIVGLDGKDHAQMRHVFRGHLHRGVAIREMESLMQVTLSHLQRLPLGQPVAIMPFLSRLFFEQLAAMFLRTNASEYGDDIHTLMRYTLNIGMRRWPKWMMHHPHYRRARRRKEELAQSVLQEHRASVNQRDPDLVDVLVQAYEQGMIPSETDLLTAILDPIFAAHGTVSTCASAIYCLLKYPHLLACVQKEVDALLASGEETSISVKQLGTMCSLDRILTETMRLYPIVPVILRTAAKQFTFAGYRIDAGETVLVATPVANFLPEYHPNPSQFDPDRYLSPRNESRDPSVFVPFGFGEHKCLGEGIAWTQMKVTLSLMLRYLQLELVPLNYTMQQTMDLVLAPHHLRVRIRERKNE